MENKKIVKVRSVYILLHIALNNTHHFKHGLCVWYLRLYHMGVINSAELDKILNYIKNNKPFLAKILNKSFYWESDNIKPRIKWIQKHIELHNKKIEEIDLMEKRIEKFFLLAKKY